MRLLKRFAQGDLRLNRIEAFSDGVFAIVVTFSSDPASSERMVSRYLFQCYNGFKRVHRR
jgi:hypothetical protein